MNLLNLIENATTGYDNLRALMQAAQSGQDAVLNVGGETITLDPMETRWMVGKYKAFNKAGRQEEFLSHLADPVKFDQHMKQLRQLIDKQKNFQGSVPGQRGVEGDTMPGQMEESQAVEEIAQQDPNNMSASTRGKLNWENMIKDYMANKPYTEFEFSSDRPLTIYRTQIYAILKAFGNMKPQNKVNIILNTFGDKLATVEYLDKLRAKGLMPKKVPAYVSPDAEPVPPEQMSLPGMDTPKIREADDQKKNSKTTDLDGAVNPRVARAMQLARARQSAAGTDTEAMVADFVDQQEKDQAEFNKVKSVNRRQDDLLKQITAVNQQQDREIDSLDSDNAELQNNLQQLQAVNADLAKKLADVGQRRADRQQSQPQQTPVQAEPTSAQPAATAEPPLQQTTTVAQPTPAKKKKTTRKKSSATKVQKPQQEIPNNVLQFPQGGRSGQASDEVAAALQGVDMGDELGTGTFGLRENSETLNIGDPVIIAGNVEFKGKTGDIVGFGRDKNFVIVDLYNFGKHAFHASNVQYNDYADEEDYVDEGRLKDQEIERQWQAGQQFSQDFKRKEQSAGEQEPVGDFRVVRRKDGIVSDLKQHYSSNKAFAHAQALKKKYPSMEVGVRWPTGQINWVGITEDEVNETQVDINRFNTNQPMPGGTNKEREEFLNARDRLFRQMQSATPGEKEAIRLKIAELEGRAQSQGIKIRETDDLNRAGYNAIKSLSDWQEKMRVVGELQKDQALMQDPESKDAVEQRIGDLLKIGIKQGYVKEALNDKAMAVLRGLKAPAQAQTAEPVSAEKQAELDAWAQDFQKNVADRYGKQVVAPKPQIDLNVPAKTEPEMDLATVQKKIAQLDELIKLKELIDKLFLKAQKVRGGIHRGLQSDIENEELYGVPQNDRDFETLRDKYTKDLKALQQFLAMKKIAWKESVERLSESTALVRLQQARQKLSSQSSLKESLRPGEYHVATVTLDNGDVRKFKVTFDEGYTEAIKKFYARQGRTVKNIDMDWSVQGDFYEQTMPGTKIPQKSVMQGYTVFYDPRTKTVSVTRGGDSAEAAIEQARINTPSLKAFRQVVDRMIDKIEAQSDNVTEETQDDRNARIIAGEIEDAISQGNDELVKQKIKQLIGVGYTLDKNGKLQRMGMYEQEISVAGNPVQPEEGYYSIWIRKPGSDKWTPVVKYPTRDEAEKTGSQLKKQGHEVIIREKKDRSPGKITKSEDPCWSGYHMVGKKMKNGREVPNCVPGKKG